MSQFSKEKIEEMIDLCDQMLEKSYCIYSRFPVASVLITDCDKVFTERTAAVKAVSEGYRKFKACFVKTKSANAIGPCGACRQFLSEDDRQFVTRQLSELLPGGFSKEELESGMLK